MWLINAVTLDLDLDLDLDVVRTGWLCKSVFHEVVNYRARSWVDIYCLGSLNAVYIIINLGQNPLFSPNGIQTEKSVRIAGFIFPSCWGQIRVNHQSPVDRCGKRNLYAHFVKEPPDNHEANVHSPDLTFESDRLYCQCIIFKLLICSYL